MAFTSVTVSGTYEMPDGSAAAGFVRFRPSYAMSNGDIVVSAPVTATLNVGGAIEVDLAATDDVGTTPEGVVYLVEEHINDHPSVRKYSIEVPASPGTLDLASAAPVPVVPPTVTYLTLVAGDARYEPLGGGGGGGGLDAEGVRDTIGTALAGTGLVTVTPNDGANTITVATTATQNDTDSNLKARANHTGAQAISTVTGLQTALDALDTRLDVIERTTVSLTDASTVAINASLGKFHKVTIAGNRTIGNPTSAYDGQVLVIAVKQDASGGRTVTLDTKYRLPAGQAITWSTIANRKDRLCVQYDGDDDKFDIVGFQPGFG